MTQERASVAGAVVWVFVATAAGRLMSLASLVVLARLLAPADFGLLAFALVYITYVETVGDLGSGMALIYWPSRREDAAQVTFALNLAMGAVWFAVTQLTAPLVAAFFGNPGGETVLRALAWTFPLKTLGNTHDALCQKDLRFRARLAPELGLSGGKAVLSVALAAAGFGVWSLVWGQLAGVALWTAMLWRAVPWRPRLSWPRDLLRPMLAYGRSIVSVNVLAAVVHHADLVVVGRMLGATTLGLYHVAYKVPEMTITVVMWAVSRVLFPALARNQAGGRAPTEGYLAALRYSSLLTVPAAAALVLLAEPLVRTLFGAPWAEAASILRALAIYSGLRSLGTQAGDVLKAVGRPGLLASLGLVKAIILVPALVLAAPFGPVAIASALAAVTGLTMLLSLAAANRVGHVPARGMLAALRASFLAAAIVAAALAAWGRATGGSDGPARLAATLLVAVLAHLASVRVASPEVFAHLRSRLPWLLRAAPAIGEAGRFLVPLEAPLVRYFRHYLFVPHGWRERLAGRLPGALGRAALFRRPASGAEATVEAVASALRTGDLLHGTPLAGRPGLRFVVQRDDPAESRGRLIAFLFGEGDQRPAAVLKLRPHDSTRRTLRQEWEALRWAERLPATLAAAVPSPLAFHEGDRAEALLLSWLPGRSAYVEMQSALRPRLRVARHFAEAAAWLARFHRATRRPGRTFVPAHEPAAGPEAAADGSQSLAWIEEVERLCAERPLPLSASHGDFWARNLLLDGRGSAAVVDWEHFCEEAPPFEDLFHFPLTYGLNYPWSGGRRRPPEAAFRLTFIEDNHVSRQVRTYFRRYCAETGVAPDILAPLFHLYLSTRFSRRADAEGGLWSRFQLLLARADRSVFSGS